MDKKEMEETIKAHADAIISLDDALASTAGQLHAVRALLFAFIGTHPDPKALERAFGYTALLAEAKALPESVNDKYVAALQSLAAELHALVLDEVRDRPSPD